jgi:hypothetical protein
MIFQAAIPKGLCIPIALELGALNHEMNLIASKTMSERLIMVLKECG